MPDRRIAGSGRRADDPKVSGGTSAESSAPPQEPEKTKPVIPETPPKREHFLHRKIGGGKKAA